MTRLERVRWFCVWAGDGRERATREHRDILRLIQRKQNTDAVAAMRRHIGNSRETIMEALKIRAKASALGEAAHKTAMVAAAERGSSTSTCVQPAKLMPSVKFM